MCADNATSFNADDVLSEETNSPDVSILYELGSSDQVQPLFSFCILYLACRPNFIVTNSPSFVYNWNNT